MATIRFLPFRFAILAAISICVAACSGQRGVSEDSCQDSRFVRTYGADPFLALRLSLKAEGGSRVGTVKIRACANAEIDSARIRFHPPIPYQLEKGYGPETGPSVPLWQGELDMGEELMFERRVALMSDTFMQTAVTADFKVLNKISGAVEDHHFVIKRDTVISGVLQIARRAQLAYERRERGLADKSIEEIYEIDPKFAWMLGSPLSDPYKIDTAFVTAADGHRVPFTRVHSWRLRVMSDSQEARHSAQYALRQYYLRKYGQPQPPGHLNKQVQGRPVLPPIKIEWPDELSRDEVPDSLLYVRDDTTWTGRERGRAIRARTLELKAWIQDWKENHQSR